MMNRTLRILLLLLLWISCLTPVVAQQSLREQFLCPPTEAKPWTFWYWMYGAVSAQAITADLEAMKQVGLGGAYLMPIKSIEQGKEHGGTAEQLSPQWWQLVHHSMSEADRLGLKLGVHICDGFALAGGPWITPGESMQKVVWSDTIVSGGTFKTIALPLPETYQGYYQDIALFALPADESPDQAASKLTYGSTNPANNADPTRAISVDTAGVIRSSYPCFIQYEYAAPFTCRNIEVVVSGNNYQANRLKVMASNDGVTYWLVKQLVPPRQGWHNTDHNSTHAIPSTTARYFRFYWTPQGSEPGSEDLDDAKWKPNLKINQLRLHGDLRLNQWEGKAGLVWRVSPQTTEAEVSNAACFTQKQIINLTSSLKEGKLTTVLPPGKWKILRMGHTATGRTNATGGGGRGLECDKFSSAAVQKQFDNWFRQFFEQTDPALARRVLKYMHVDSWECGSQNWSSNLPAEFLARRGYSLMEYLPLLAGIPMESAKRSEEVLRDVRTTIAELVVDVFYKVLADCAKAYDCQLSAECVAPIMVSDDLLHYQRVDRPMGEFWLNSPTHDKLNDMLDAISGAHIYGKKIIQAEGFTEVRGTWDEHPAMLKTLLDRNYALGINKLFFHVYVHNPWMDRAPGMTLDGIGLFFQRNQTWFDNGGKALVDYATRCQALLQYGHPVVDIAVFTGEEMPRRAILPDRLVPSLPGIYGAERVESEKIRLANEGQPLRTKPVGVTHTANMADPEQWINPLRGYAYDSFNRDALLRLATVEGGRLTLPGGASYKVLVLPLARPMNPDNRPLSPEVARKVSELKQGGVVVPQLPYHATDFSADGLTPDVIVPQDIAWTHRRGDEAEVYFISNQQDEARTLTVSLRVSGKKPELWNPLTGEITEEVSYVQENGRTVVPLSLAAAESVFIVLKDPAVATLYHAPTFVTQRAPLQTKRWSVTFPAINQTVVKDQLFDWSKESDEKIAYYSGTATYQSTFHWKERKSGRIYLQLGSVMNVATVRVNGISCGTAWTAPYQVDITPALKSGENQLTIEVTNTWTNALRGADRGKAPFQGIWTNGKYRMKEDTLLPAGLLGPLEIIHQSINNQ